MTSTSQLSTKRQLTHDRIHDVARTLFSERGYDKTTVRAIASEAGVSAATVILYGDSKEALFEGLYRSEVDRVLEDALQSAPPPAPLPIQLAHVFGAMLSYYAQERVAANVLLRLRLFDGAGARGGALLDGVTQLVQRAQSTGRARGDLNPELVASTAVHLYTGCLVEMLNNPESREEALIHRLRSMLRLLEEGMSPWR